MRIEVVEIVIVWWLVVVSVGRVGNALEEGEKAADFRIRSGTVCKFELKFSINEGDW